MPRANKTSKTLTGSGTSVRAQAKKKARSILTATGSTLRQTPSVPEPSASTLLNHSQQTTDEWYKSTRTKAGYANYVKSGKKWLEEWVAGGRLVDKDERSRGQEDDPERSSFADAFDSIISQTPTALRLLTAYKCDHQGRAFATAEGLRSAFKHFFERYVCAT
jgi:hypothetical protein